MNIVDLKSHFLYRWGDPARAGPGPRWVLSAAYTGPTRPGLRGTETDTSFTSAQLNGSIWCSVAAWYRLPAFCTCLFVASVLFADCWAGHCFSGPGTGIFAQRWILDFAREGKGARCGLPAGRELCLQARCSPVRPAPAKHPRCESTEPEERAAVAGPLRSAAPASALPAAILCGAGGASPSWGTARAPCVEPQERGAGGCQGPGRLWAQWGARGAAGAGLGAGSACVFAKEASHQAALKHDFPAGPSLGPAPAVPPVAFPLPQAEHGEVSALPT